MLKLERFITSASHPSFSTRAFFVGEIMNIGMIALIILLVVVVAMMPLLLIWSINTLFLTGIAYTLKTWAATLVFVMFFGAASRK